MPETQTPAVSRRDIENALIQKAWKDPEFRRQVVKDPKGMLEQHTGQPLPAQLKIFIHEEDPTTLHFSIPPSPSNVEELSDTDLEKVAGGTDIIITSALVTLFGTAVVSAASVTVMDKDKVGW